MHNNCSSQIRLVAGGVVLLTVALGAFVSRNFLVPAGFVGFMLFQSALTGVCPAELLLPGCRE
jgi:hypothetical protein